MDLQEFHRQLQSDVIALAGGGGSGDDHGQRTREEAFTEIVAEDLSIAGVLESPLVYYYEGGAKTGGFKVNGFSIPEEDSRLDLFITLYFADANVQKINSADVAKAFARLKRFFKSAQFSVFVESLEPNSEAYAMASEIHANRASFERVQLLIFSNAVLASRKDAENEETLNSYKLVYQIWDLERLRRLRTSSAIHEPISVDLTQFVPGGIPCVSSIDVALGYKTCLALLPGNVLYKLYDDYAGRLLELNVRSYLQARGKINKGILETLTLNPLRFLAYNNGITVVAESLEFSKDGLRIQTIHGLQIVNGGQTTASIHRAKIDQDVDISHVYVQAKLTVVPQEHFETMVTDISRFSNTQNKVSEVDLGANHPYHIGVERLSRRQWAPGEKSMWFYERARGSYQTERFRQGRTDASRKKFDVQYPPNQRFTKEDLARFHNTWVGLPHIVSKGGQKNFVRFMEEIAKIKKGWEPTVAEFKIIVGKAIFYREVQRIARELDISSFRVNIVTYTASLIAERTARRINLEKLWEMQGVPAVLETLIKTWMPEVSKILVASVGSRNPTEWFKLEGCWTTLRSATRDWTVPAELGGDLTNIEVDGKMVSTGEANDIALCMELTAEDWFRVQMWGSTTHKLEGWQIGIANTLSGYAGTGWKKRPSIKQARHGVKIMELYKIEQAEN